MYNSKGSYSQNITPNIYEEDEHCIYNNRLQESQQALSIALSNISDLQQNLTFMIDLNSRLKEQNQRLKIAQQKATKTSNKIISQQEKRITEMKQQNLEIAELLEETKGELIDISTQLKTCEDEIVTKENIIRQQKKAYMDLQFKFMNTSISYIGDGSCLADNKDCQYIAELEKQNVSLQTTIKRCEQLLEKEKNRSNKMQKEINEFKQWMGSVLGLQKVIDGSEKILMNQIAQRVINI